MSEIDKYSKIDLKSRHSKQHNKSSFTLNGQTSNVKNNSKKTFNSNRKKHSKIRINLYKLFQNQFEVLQTLHYSTRGIAIKFFNNVVASLTSEQVNLINKDRFKLTNEQEQQFSKIVSEGKQLIEQRKKSINNIHYPDNLPVSQRIDIIRDTIKNNQVVVIAGDTGSGKTTQIPKLCLELGLGLTGFIGHTQPRRIAARSVASRIAKELNSELGDIVGYKVRFNEQININSQIKLMTDGILLSEIHNDRLLQQYSCLIIDEAHERSLNNDFILGYLQQILSKRPDLKLIITSATIDVEKFSKYFNNAPIIEVEGRTYDVEVRYRPIEENEDTIEVIEEVIDSLYKESLGDILIFLNGEREIRDLSHDLQGIYRGKNIDVLPLYARLSVSEQNAIFNPNKKLRIILSTNVAETSLTIPNIKYVIDLGTARISRYSYRSQMQLLPIEDISQASANQRKGRCGRVANGICVRLYDEESFNFRPEFTDPEILRTNLSSVILKMMSIGLTDISSFPFIDKPDNRYIRDGFKRLEYIGAISRNGDKYVITDLGKKISDIPLDPSLSRMILAANDYGALAEVLIITTGLSIMDPRERPTDKQMQADQFHAEYKDKESDFITYLNLWKFLHNQTDLSKNQFRKMCKNRYLNFIRIREWQDLYKQISLIVTSLKLKFNILEADYISIHRSLLAGLLTNIGQKVLSSKITNNNKTLTSNNTKTAKNIEYLGANGRKFNLIPGSSIYKKSPNWVLAAEIIETTKVWARNNAYIEPQWIIDVAKGLLKYHYTEAHWSKKRKEVVAFARISLFGLTIVDKSLVSYGAINPVEAREVFIREVLINGDLEGDFPFWQHNNDLLAQVYNLEEINRRRDIVVSEDELYEFYDQRLPIEAKIYSLNNFTKFYNKQFKNDKQFLFFRFDNLVNNTDNLLELPKYWLENIRGNQVKMKINYVYDHSSLLDGLVVDVPIQLLNQLNDKSFSWHIAHYRLELVTELIRNLPKQYRKQLVPAPNFAKIFIDRVVSNDKEHIFVSLSNLFRRINGADIPVDAWSTDRLAAYLRVHFKIIGIDNNVLGSGDNLEQLQKQLNKKIETSIADSLPDYHERNGIVTWDFDKLPKKYIYNSGALEIEAFPALVDRGNSVDIKVFATAVEQYQSMRMGIIRLLLLNCTNPIKYLHENLPNRSKLSLYFNPFGNINLLIDDCIKAACLSLVNEFGFDQWQKDKFEKLLSFVRGNINSRTIEVISIVESILIIAYQVNTELKKKLDLSVALSISYIKQQLKSLIYQGFVSSCSIEQLKNYSRYLNAIIIRLDRIHSNINKDNRDQREINRCLEAYDNLRNSHNAKYAQQEILHIFFMIQELHVSLFAQTLGVPHTVSEKRILNYINECKIKLNL